MLMLWRSCRSTSRIPFKSLYSQAGVQPVLDLPPLILNVDSPWSETRGVEGFQGELKNTSVSEAKKLLSIAVEHKSQDVSVQGIQENYSNLVSQPGSIDLYPDIVGQDAHLPVLQGMNSHVSLHGCMQSNVPFPHNPDTHQSTGWGYTSCHNMPGYSNRLQDKYMVGALNQCHPSRHFSTSTNHRASVQGSEEYQTDFGIEDPSPQGIQGEDCVRFKLWMENCQRYSLPNCDEQMQALRTGQKTVAEVFLEQQMIIEKVSEEWRKKNNVRSKQGQISSQGVQDDSYNFEFIDRFDPCPQGLQGDDCANYRVWSHNCRAMGFGDCADKIQSVRSGQKTVQDLFEEQDALIRKIVKDFQQKRKYSTSSNPEVRSSDSSPLNSTPSPPDDNKLSSKDKLKRAMKEYGGTVIVFHIGISLISLGGFYLAVTRYSMPLCTVIMYV